MEVSFKLLPWWQMRKTASILLAVAALVIFGFGLSGCSKGRSTVISNTPTAILTATPTQSPTPRPSATITPTRRPTFTPTPILPDLPDLSYSEDQYELVEPSIPVLGLVLHYAESLEKESWELYSDQRALSELVSADADYQFEAAMFSLQQQAKQNPLDLDSLFRDFAWGHWLYTIGNPPQNAVDVILAAVTYDIQKQAHRFQDQLTITQKTHSLTPYRIELDHDAGAEWLVQVKITDTGLLCFLLFDENEDGSYRRLESQIPNLSQDASMEHKVLLLQDFTGDGLTDILISKYFYLMGSNVTTYYVSQGRKTGMTLLETYYTNGYAYTYQGPIPSQVVDETALAGLKITYSESISWDCYWDHEVTYHWVGGVEQKYETGILPPNTPECKLAKAVSLTDPVDDQTAIPLLQSAIQTLNPEHTEKLAFAHYRLALLYIKNGQQAQARKHLETMRNLDMNDPVTSEYLETALAALLAQPELSLLPVCQFGYNAPYEAFPVWRESTHSTRVYHSYPGGEPVPEAVCPLVGLVEGQMNKIDFDGTGSPKAAIQNVGLPVQSIQSFSLSNQGPPSWFAVLDTEPYIVIAYVPYAEDDTYLWKRMTIFTGGDSEPIWLNQDITGDGLAEMAIAVKDMYYRCMNEDEAAYKMLLTGAWRKNMISSIEGFECFSTDAPFNLAEAMKDKDGDGLSDLMVKFGEGILPDSGLLDSEIQRDGPVTWFTREEILNMTQPLEQPEPEEQDEDPEMAIFHGANPAAVRQEIQKLLDDFSPDSLHYQHIHDRYAYLIALSYELEGNTQEAIRAYLELAQSKPGTIWSSLAAARLKQK